MMVLSVMTDANFAVAQTELRSGRTDAGFVFGGGLALYLAWLLGTALGALLGNAFAPLDRFGVDVTLGAFFGAIVVSQIAAERWRLLPVASACAVAFLAADALPAGWSIVLAAIVGGAVAAVRHDA
jgi:predicted branched-subunit amino acid permease